MKKLTAILLMLTMLFALASCDEQTPDSDDGASGEEVEKESNNEKKSDANAEELYAKALDTMQKLGNFTIEEEFTYTAENGQDSMSLHETQTTYADIEAKRVFITSHLISTHTMEDVSEEDGTITTYYDPSVYMFNSDGFKVMADMVEEELENEMAEDVHFFELDFDGFVDCSVADGGNTIKIKGFKSDSALNELLGGNASMFEDVEIDLSEVELTIQIDEENRITSIAFKMEFTAEGTTVKLDYTVHFSAFGSTADKIVKPNDAGYSHLDLDMILHP